jgi:hypothetical protein
MTTLFIKDNNIKYLPCWCGEGKTVVHHVDYAQPLKVAFLCHTCHHLAHNCNLATDLVVHDLRELVSRGTKD